MPIGVVVNFDQALAKYLRTAFLKGGIVVDKNLLDRVYIASPCNANWNDMKGDERARLCMQCSKHVYNISDMTKGEAEALLAQKGTSACMRIYRRRDGTIMTDDCPVGLRKIRNGFRLLATAAATVISFVCSISIASAKPPSHKDLAKNKSPIRAGVPKKSAARIKKTADKSKDDYFAHFPIAGGISFANFRNYVLPARSALVTGKYALQPDEICEFDNTIFLRVAESRIDDDVNSLQSTIAVEKLDAAMTAADVFNRAQAQEQSQQFKTAELYYRLTMKYFEEYHSYEVQFQKDVAGKYSHLLRSQGKFAEACALENEYRLSNVMTTPLVEVDAKLSKPQ